MGCPAGRQGAVCRFLTFVCAEHWPSKVQAPADEHARWPAIGHCAQCRRHGRAGPGDAAGCGDDGLDRECLVLVRLLPRPTQWRRGAATGAGTRRRPSTASCRRPGGRAGPTSLACAWRAPRLRQGCARRPAKAPSPRAASLQGAHANAAYVRATLRGPLQGSSRERRPATRKAPSPRCPALSTWCAPGSAGAGSVHRAMPRRLAQPGAARLDGPVSPAGEQGGVHRRRHGAASTARASDGCRPVTAGTPGFMMPAFSRGDGRQRVAQHLGVVEGDGGDRRTPAGGDHVGRVPPPAQARPPARTDRPASPQTERRRRR